MPHASASAIPRRAARLVLAAPLALSLALAGCAGPGGPGDLFSSTSYDDPSDPCNASRQPLLQSRTTFAQSIIAGAASVFQGIGSGPGPSFGGGNPLGNLGGSLGGYFAARAQQFRSQPQLIAAIDRDAASDNRSLVGARNAVGSLTRCRRKQAADIDRDYRAHRISSTQAREQLETVRKQVRGDDSLISDVLGKVGDRSKTYNSAKQEAAGQSRSSGSRAASPSSGATGALQQTERQTEQQQTEHREVGNGLQKRIDALSAAVG